MGSTVNGTLQTYSYEFGYADLLTTTFGAQGAIELHDILPEGWEVYDVDVETTTSFNGSGARTLDIGPSGNGDGIIDGLDVKAAGIKSPTVVRYRSTASTQLVLNLITGTDNPTAGAIRVTLILMHVAKEA